MGPLNLESKLRYEVKNGKILIDFDQLLNIMFEMCKDAGKLADDVKDPMMSIMALGATSAFEGVETVYRLIAEQEGLPLPPKPVEGLRTPLRDSD